MFKKVESIEELGFTVKINITKNVLDRIFRTVSNSSVEEGGKFVGEVYNFSNTLQIDIISYLDSGPKVSKSTTHIIPDGKYQESLFRLIENYNTRIEHVGTWHSHHCNGLKVLSGGDELGYFSTVNSSNYNLNYFFALLVTDVNRSDLMMKYYLFKRNDRTYYQLNQNNVAIIPLRNKIPRVLTFMETLNNNNHGDRKIYAPIVGVKRKSHKEDIKLNNIRMEDNIWLRKKFHSVVSKKNKLTNVVSWRWNVNGRNNRLKFIYSHPPFLGRFRKIASFRIFINDNKIKRIKIPLNSQRFEKIAFHFNNSIKII